MTEPESGFNNPFKLLKVNVLPAPEAPKMPTNSPFFTLKEILSKSFLPLGSVLEILITSIILFE
jgi:hypothetical protein